MKITARNMKWLIYFQIIYVLVMRWAISVLHLPSRLTYLTDFVNFILFLFSVWHISRICKRTKFNSVLYAIIAFCIVVTMTAVMNGVSIYLYLWACRNTFRYFMFMFSCIVILDGQDIDKLFGIMLKIQVVNIILCLHQYVILGLSRDVLGGIFGTTEGCNSSSNVFFCILLIYALCKYLNKMGSLKLLLFVILTTMGLAAIQELKIYYFEIVLIFLIVTVLNRPTRKSFIIIVGGIATLVIGLHIMKKIFPAQYNVLVNIDLLLRYSNSEGGGYGLSRINAFGQLTDLFFRNDLIKQLFGFGFGACEMSTFDSFTSRFYQMYEKLNYRWFGHAMLYLETGYVGFLLFVLIMVAVAIHAWRHRNYISTQYRYYIIFVITFSIITIANLWYNAAIRQEIGYLTFFCLVLIPILLKKNFRTVQKPIQMS